MIILRIWFQAIFLPDPGVRQDFARTWPAPAPEDRTPHPHRKTATFQMSSHNFLHKLYSMILRRFHLNHKLWEFYLVLPFFQSSRTSDLVAGFDKKNLWFLGVYGEYWSPFVRYCKRLLVLLIWRGIEPKNKELKNKCDVNLCSCWNDSFLRVLLLIFFVLISIAAENAYKWIKIYNQLTQHTVHF